MKQFEIEGISPRIMLIGAITNTKVLHSVSQMYKPEYIQDRCVRHIIDWTLWWFDKYGKAPESHIEDIFHKKTKNLNKD